MILNVDFLILLILLSILKEISHTFLLVLSLHIKRCMNTLNKIQLEIRKKRIKTIEYFIVFIMIFLLNISAVKNLYAAFEQTSQGARPAGMGNAFLAVADDANTLHYNPAGAARIVRTELSASYAKLLSGVTNDNSNLGSGYIGFASPIGRMGTIGLSWSNFSLANAYQENSYGVSYGRFLWGQFAVGATIKRLSIDYVQDGYTERDPVFNYGKQNSASAISADIGFLTKPIPALSFGMVLANFNRPSVSLKDSNIIPMDIKSGLAWHRKSSVLAVDGVMRKKDFTIHAGGEKWFLNKIFVIRAGSELGSSDLRNVTAGFGFQSGSFQVDYAFHLSLGGLAGGFGSHRAGLSLRFGLDPEAFAEKEKQRKRQEQIRKILERRQEDFYNRGLSYLNNGEYEIAILQWEQVLKLNSQHELAAKGIEDAKKKIHERDAAAKKQMDSLIYYMDKLQNQLKNMEGNQQEAEQQHLEKAQSALEKIQKYKSQLESQQQKTEQAQKIKLEQVQQQAQKEVSRVTSYRVIPGESLQSIAQKLYGDATRWEDIFKANQDKIHRGTIESGQSLIIP